MSNVIIGPDATAVGLAARIPKRSERAGYGVLAEQVHSNIAQLKEARQDLASAK